MRIVSMLAAVALLLVGACGTTPVAESAGDYAGDPAQRPLGVELFPTTSSTAQYVLTRGRVATVTVTPTDEGALMQLGSGGDADAAPREIAVRRREGAFWFANGPSYGVELIRFGVGPGATWASEGMDVRFEGWERVEVPAGRYDCARIRTTRGRGDIRRVETWWFAPDVGLVRLETDAAGLFREAFERVTR